MPTKISLSNLTVRSNLLSDDYQVEILLCSVFELRDTARRCENLDLKSRLSPIQKQEWRQSLFWGEPVRVIRTDWATDFLKDLEESIQLLEESPDVEAVFECLVVLNYLDGTISEKEVWLERLHKVLERPEFEMTAELIEERLSEIVGRRIAG